MNEIKKKIEKLLNLSMSDNENEARLALERAVSSNKVKRIKDKDNYEKEAKRHGAAEADKIDINMAVSKQKNIKQISA